MAHSPSAPPRTIRVAHVIQNLNYGGMERVLHSLAHRLPRRGFDVHIVVLEYFGRFAEGMDEVATLHQVPPMSRLSLLRPGNLISALRGIAPDVVHSHTGVWLKGARAARLAGVRHTVHTEHGRPDPIPLSDRLIDNWASRSTEAVIAVSEALAKVLRRSVVHAPSSVRVITNGIDLDRLAPTVDAGEVRRELGIPLEAPVIGSVGRLEPVKNYHLALRAFARLGVPEDRERAPWLILAGDGRDRQELEALAETLGVKSRVKFLGWRGDVERLYGAFDLFTLTSRSEGTSISLLEAMSSGVCPVVTDVGGNRAVLGPELGSLLVPEDASALAAAWQRYLQDPGLAAEMGRRARDRVETTFSLDRMTEQYATLYRELVGVDLRAR